MEFIFKTFDQVLLLKLEDVFFFCSGNLIGRRLMPFFSSIKSGALRKRGWGSSFKKSKRPKKCFVKNENTDTVNALQRVNLAVLQAELAPFCSQVHEWTLVVRYCKGFQWVTLVFYFSIEFPMPTLITIQPVPVTHFQFAVLEKINS